MIRVVLKASSADTYPHYICFNNVLDVTSLSHGLKMIPYDGLCVKYASDGRIIEHVVSKHYIVSSVQWIDDVCDDDW